jgi:DNA-binding NtrC family response regulator
MTEAEHIIIRDTLSFLKGNKSRAAETLGIGRKTLHRKLAEMKGESAADMGAVDG